MLHFFYIPSPSCRRCHRPASDIWAPLCSTRQMSGCLQRWTGLHQHQPATNQSINQSVSLSVSHKVVVIIFCYIHLCSKACSNKQILPQKSPKTNDRFTNKEHWNVPTALALLRVFNPLSMQSLINCLKHMWFTYKIVTTPDIKSDQLGCCRNKAHLFMHSLAICLEH